ncbi:PREDICTED: putative methyl-CpG-binding domain protein 3-like 3 [Myotis brandtii]|uniref:putative methyl-CpG-binding domain protein 3-like 3 n=1 Tax=Myotis brandtii TaxID=109478 RepID=UPI0007041A98|nr:PREDICTED: putative methyl-CpG-binding domain protein 3-like 3 [Myotis brandtii]
MGEPGSIMKTNQGSLGKLQRNMMPQTLAKKRQLVLAMSKWRRQERTELPMRLTSCIFKSAVTKVTAHPDNVVRRRRQEETLEEPQQMSACRRLQGLPACGSEGGRVNTLDVTNVMRTTAPGRGRETLGRAGPGSLHTSPQPSAAQLFHGVEMIPGAGLCGPQLLCRQLVTHGDIQRQNLRVRKARERLAGALREDRLAREAESQESRRTF